MCQISLLPICLTFFLDAWHGKGKKSVLWSKGKGEKNENEKKNVYKSHIQYIYIIRSETRSETVDIGLSSAPLAATMGNSS